MYDSEELVNYNLFYCHACLGSNTTLNSVGDYLDIYIKICDNSRMNLTSQVNICSECMCLLKKVHEFKRKVEDSQKILDYCVNKQVPLEDYLANLTPFSTETINLDYYPILEDADKSVNTEDPTEDELLCKIQDVRGRCDILDVKRLMDLSTSSCKAGEPPAEENLRHRQWKRAALLVYKGICGHRYAHHFLRPVSDEFAPLYSRTVRRPMDLSTIKRHIKEDIIRSTAELTRALLLMFSNALLYNSSDHRIYQSTLEFREETLRELSLLQAVNVEADCPPARALVPAALRRLRSHSVWEECVAPVGVSNPPVAPLSRRSAPALVRRRNSEWDASHEGTPAAPEASQALGRRRKSVRNASHEDQMKTAVAPRAPRCTSVSLTPEHAPVSLTAAHAPKRRKWDWPCLDNDQYLVANGFRKYKSTVLL